MKINYNNQEIKIQFFYPSGKCGSRTECRVLIGEPNSRDEQKKVAGTSSVRRHSKDTPNLVLARTIALFRALYAASYSHAQSLEIIESIGIRYIEADEYMVNV